MTRLFPVLVATGLLGLSGGAVLAVKLNGTLTESARAAVDEALTGETASSDTVPLFVGKTPTRNPDCWARQWDWTGVSVDYAPGNPTPPTYEPVTLISPRHVIGANHYWPFNATAQVTFVTASGLQIKRTVIKSRQIENTDIKIGLLDSDVPAGLKIYRVFTPKIRNHDVPDPTLVPVVYTDGSKEAHLGQMERWTKHWSGLEEDPNNADWYNLPHPGDSGSPLFVPLNDHEMALFACFDLPDGGPNISNYLPQINAAMATLGGGYQVREVHLK